MRGTPQASVSRLPNVHSGLRWSVRITRMARELRRRERLEILERVRRERRRVSGTDTHSPDLRRQWLRRI
jgi:hypothetical protein